jgi:hypothetical protein
MHLIIDFMNKNKNKKMEYNNTIHSNIFVTLSNVAYISMMDYYEVNIYHLKFYLLSSHSLLSLLTYLNLEL